MPLPKEICDNPTSHKQKRHVTPQARVNKTSAETIINPLLGIRKTPVDLKYRNETSSKRYDRELHMELN